MTGTEGVNQPRWSVGALAKATGLTVRTLHHYDELGLLRAGSRTQSGHRRYTEGDLRWLQQILLLRQLGMSLDGINNVLADSAGTGALAEVLTEHLGRLDDQVRRLTALRHQTWNLLEQLNGAWQPDPSELLALLGHMTTFDQYITKEQRASLDERADELGAAGNSSTWNGRWSPRNWPPTARPTIRSTIRKYGKPPSACSNW